MTEKEKTINLIDELLIISEKSDKEQNPEKPGKSWLVFHLEALKEMVQKINEKKG